MKINSKSFTPLAVSKDIVVQELKNEILIYNCQNHQAMSLNETMACVWQHCNGLRTVPEIKTIASQKLNAKVSDEIIFLALDQLAEHNLLEKGALPSAETSTTLPRREVLRRIGLTAVVAIPMITAITAPKAIHAQSAAALKPDGQGCTLDSECQNDCCDSGICSPAAICFI